MKHSWITASTTLSILLLFCAPAAAAEFPGRIADSPDSVCPLLPGTQVPDSSVQDLQGNPVSLRSLALEKPAVLIFFRGGW